MKKILSSFLAFVIVLSFVPVQVAEAAEVSAQVETEGVDDALSAQLFGAGSDSDFQISAIEPQSPDNVLVTYTASVDCTLVLTVSSDPDGQQLAKAEEPVPTGTGQVVLSTGLEEFPRYFRLTASLCSGDRALSDEYVNYDYTQEHEQFLAMTPDDETFEGQTVLDLGPGSDGRNNFAVVREDVHVVTVSSIEDVCLDAVLLDETGGEYLLPDEGDEIAAGDKILILSEDDRSSAIPLIAGEVEHTMSLLDSSGNGNTVSVTPANETAGMEDFYSYVRMNVDFSADTDDLDTSTVDPIVEFEDVQLFGSNNIGFDGSKTFSIPEQNFGGIRVNDSLTLAVDGNVSIEYSWNGLNKFEVSTTLSATNVFTINAQSDIKPIERSVRLGEIPIGGIPGLWLSIPVEMVFRADFNASFNFTTTQKASTTITAGYRSGACYCTATSEASSGRELRTEARATASLGVKAGLEITALDIVKADVSGEVGVEAVAIAQSINSTADYQHMCRACMDVSLYVYARPSFSLRVRKYIVVGEFQQLAGKAGSGVRSKIMGFYVSWRGGNNWVSGYGTCPNKKYRVTITVLDGATNKPVSGVDVERLGKTGNDGKVSGFLQSGQYYNLALRHGSYEDDWVGVYVGSSPVNERVSLYIKTNNEAVLYSMKEWSTFSDDELKNLITENLQEGIQVNLEDAGDLELLAVYTISGKPTVSETGECIEFYMSTNEKEIDLSELDWVPIGNERNPFRGIFNGSHVTFTGLHVPADPQNRTNYRGFFGAVSDGAWVHDLTLSDVSLNGDEGNPLGAVADVIKGNAEISDVTVSGAVSGTIAGGIAGSMNGGSIRNSYVGQLTVTGSQYAGGLVGSYTAAGESEIANCYSTAQVSGGKAGALCGQVVADASQNTGLMYDYYLDTATPFGEIADGVDPLAFSLTDAQAKGTESVQSISEDSSVPYASATTLLEALNLWYADFGAFVNVPSDKPQNDEVQNQPSTQTIPDSDPQDKYNHWYADALDSQGNFRNGGYPVFATRPPVYTLRVHYSYADGSEAKPTVVVYYEKGAEYDVDPYKIEGYSTNDVEYKGIMPGYDLDFFVVYYPETVYAGDAKELTGNKTAAAGEIYRVNDAADLNALAAYTGNTFGVKFEQTADITVTDWTGIGTRDNPFKGSYQGLGRAVSGLDAPLFGYTDGAQISNLTLTAHIESQEEAGILVVQAKDSQLTNCTVSGSLTSGKNAGGIAAQLLDGSQANICKVSATIQGGDGTGGIAAVCTDSILTNCSFTGSARVSSGNLGGLTGAAENATIENSFVSADLIGGANAGGVSGTAQNVKMQNVFFAGTVSGAEYSDSITQAATGGEFVNVFYPAELSTAVSSAKSYTINGIADLKEHLNTWVQERNSASYYTWEIEMNAGLSVEGSEDNEVSLPVHSLPYDNWLVDLTVKDGLVSFTFDEFHYSEFKAMIALYDENGQMLVCREIPEGQSSFTVTEQGCAYAKAFLCDKNMIPAAVAVATSA